ncbi:MAG: ABC transporter ATP-binding protein [Campylobacteraceae bacterium]
MKDILYLLGRFKSYYKDYVPQFVFAIIGMILAASGGAATAYLVEPVLNKIFMEKNEQLLYLLPFAIILVYFVKELGRYLQTYFTAYIGQDIVRRFRNMVLENLLKLDISFFHAYRSGELISRNTSDIDRIRMVVSNMVPEFLREVLSAIGLLGVVFYQSVQLSFFALIVMPLAIYPLTRLAKRMKKVSYKSQEKTSDITSRLGEIFSNIEIIKANTSENFEHDRFAEDNKKFQKLNMKAVKISALASPLMEMLGSISMAAVIIIGGKQVIDGGMSVGSFFSFVTALFLLYTPIKRVSALYNQMQDAVAASERTFFLLDQKPTIISGDKEFPKSVNSIDFKNISLEYGDKRVLKDISLHVNKGEFIAFVGNSGGGKSSLVNLLIRFFDVNSGEILINNTDIKDYKLDELRKNVAIVTQRVYIFNDSVAENVAYGEKIDTAKVIDALKLANAYEFVSELENGIDTVLSEDGSNLSGGQRQRIAIARAIYKNPKILILDEATSALDNESEQKITEALEHLIKDKITFVIAHRLSTVKKADRIVLLKHGEIVAIGSDDELNKNSEDYKNLKSFAYDK